MLMIRDLWRGGDTFLRFLGGDFILIVGERMRVPRSRLKEDVACQGGDECVSASGTAAICM